MSSKPSGQTCTTINPRPGLTCYKDCKNNSCYFYVTASSPTWYSPATIDIYLDDRYLGSVASNEYPFKVEVPNREIVKLEISSEPDNAYFYKWYFHNPELITFSKSETVYIQDEAIPQGKTLIAEFIER